MLLTCRKCRQREVAFDGIKGLCPVCQQESDLSKPPQRRGRNAKAALLIQSKVSPGRVSMTGPLLTVLAAAAVAIVSEVVRFSAERTRAHQWALAAANDGYDRQALHSALQTINTTNMLRFAAFMAVLYAYQRWARAGHANAMSRTDIGLGWTRALPGGRGVVWTYGAWLLSVFAALYLSFVTNSNLQTPGDYETAANVDAIYSLVRIALAVLLSMFVVQLTLGLNKLLATPQTMDVADRPVELQTIDEE
ncbi:hypothetical protein M878_12065 [Streptomyces roseochromogenus subsp. oscitans DS 12.976]|uniref:Uncharacterized protein n=1 Tax=Streptomyces roseochromogenus subsp. oscitans DS 12.976 TaxID=1352936 RepID=V6KXS0_STRRC|nr:hypothetical protein M878_12065 [Streptomyces roseochromogenus subsp. oscitans DS 12.976]